MSKTEPKPHFTTLTDVVRYLTGGITTRIGRHLWAWGIHPDMVTFMGFVMVGVASYAIAQGEFFWAAMIMIAGTPFDALDGAVARAMQRVGKFGALWDSTLDRYADALLYVGFALYFSRRNDETALLLALAALIGSLLVSYVRARAGGLRVDCEVGLLTRMERTFVILAMLLTGWVKPGLWILAIGTNLTVAHRVWHVYRELKRAGR